MAKAGDDWNRCYYGTIRRSHNENGKPIVYGNIKIGNEFILANAPDQWELGRKLDEMVLLILDYDLREKLGNDYWINAN